jgi:hypothetical protein
VRKARECKTYRLRIGRLTDGREAFAKAGYCISALGDYRFVEVWVRNRQRYGGMALLADRPHAGPRTRSYREAFAMIVKGREKRIPGTMPIRIAQQLGWTK